MLGLIYNEETTYLSFNSSLGQGPFGTCPREVKLKVFMDLT
jgi:hypothetical protein